MRRYRFTFLFFIVIEIIAIFAIGYYIFKKNDDINKLVSINSIDKKSIQYVKNNNLNYFYELNPNSIQKIKVDWLNYNPIYSFNSDGLNDRFNYSIKKGLKTFRIIALGDSFVFGQYLKNVGESWPERLEDILNKTFNCKNYNKFEVINLGVYGYDIKYSTERLRTKGIKYDADLLIFFLKDDDFQIINDYFLPLEEKIRNELKLNKNSPDYFKKNNIVYPTWQKATNIFLNKYGKNNILDYQKKAMTEISDYFKKSIILVTFPKTAKEYKKMMADYSKTKHNIFFHETYDIYNKKGLTFPDYHPNQKGHSTISNDLFDYLTKNKIIPCN